MLPAGSRTSDTMNAWRRFPDNYHFSRRSILRLTSVGWISRPAITPRWRTSETSAVGLLPAALQGFDIDGLLCALDPYQRLPSARRPGRQDRSRQGPRTPTESRGLSGRRAGLQARALDGRRDCPGIAVALRPQVRRPAAPETVFKVCEHLAANPGRGVRRVGGRLPATARLAAE